MNPSLSGLGVLLTRPAEAVGTLEKRLAAAGAEVHCLPVLELSPFAGPGLDTALAHYAHADLAVFVSAHAVRFGVAALAAHGQALHPGPTLAAVGQATERALLNAGGRSVLCAGEGSDSEALLALPRLQAVTGQTVLLFRGASAGGGRTLLGTTLAARGARVLEAVCYHRQPSRPDPANVAGAARALAAGRVHAVQVMSTESLDALLGLLPAALLDRASLFAPHPRIAAAARARGLTDVQVVGFGEDAFLSALAGLPASRR